MGAPILRPAILTYPVRNDAYTIHQCVEKWLDKGQRYRQSWAYRTWRHVKRAVLRFGTSSGRIIENRHVG